MGESVLDSIDPLGHEARLGEEFGGLKVREPVVQYLLRQYGDGMQQGHGHLRADDGCGLEEVFLGRGQAVDAGGQDRLDGIWDAQRERMLLLLRTRNPVGPGKSPSLCDTTLAQREGGALSCAPCADAVAGRENMRG